MKERTVDWVHDECTAKKAKNWSSLFIFHSKIEISHPSSNLSIIVLYILKNMIICQNHKDNNYKALFLQHEKTRGYWYVIFSEVCFAHSGLLFGTFGTIFAMKFICRPKAAFYGCVDPCMWWHGMLSAKVNTAFGLSKVVINLSELKWTNKQNMTK